MRVAGIPLFYLPLNLRRRAQSAHESKEIMRERTLVKDLAAKSDGPVLLGGWVEKLRDQKRIQFIILRDESGDVQVTYPRPVVGDEPDENDALAAKVSTLTSGSFVWVTGRLVHDERVK
ncbi:MAG: hypothetical protein RLZZ108_676, partial [Actinomycetota bacterium]